MADIESPASWAAHSHVFLGENHERAERRTWAVIWLCAVMMVAEIVGGALFGSLALVADGLHMSTHASAMLIAALAYSFARKHARDRRFVFGTGKLGDLAGFTSAVILAMIALLIGYEAVERFLTPVPIHFGEAIPIAAVGLLVNITSAWLLSGRGHDHGHAPGHGHPDHGLDHAGHGHDHADHAEHGHDHTGQEAHAADDHGVDTRDHNIRSAYIHVIADAMVSVLAIIGLSLAKAFGWLWMDPLAGIVGALVIANWSYGLMRDTGAILLDISSSGTIDERIRSAVESAGDKLIDLHVWRVGPGHFAAVASIVSRVSHRGPAFYHEALRRLNGLSHITVEVHTLTTD
jgi:cation diffusion facilitator family transporter